MESLIYLVVYVVLLLAAVIAFVRMVNRHSEPADGQQGNKSTKPNSGSEAPLQEESEEEE